MADQSYKVVLPKKIRFDVIPNVGGDILLDTGCYDKIISIN